MSHLGVVLAVLILARQWIFRPQDVAIRIVSYWMQGYIVMMATMRWGLMGGLGALLTMIAVEWLHVGVVALYATYLQHRVNTLKPKDSSQEAPHDVNA